MRFGFQVGERLVENERDNSSVARELLPVLVREAVECLSPRAGATMLDGTVGFAGHASVLLESLGSNGLLIGLDRDAVEVIGELPTYETRTGFSVKPIVGLIKPPIELNIDSKEVADVFEIPLSFVLDRKNHERHSREWQNTMRNFYVFPHPKYYIWGATAGMLVNLAELILSVDGTSNNGY